MFLIHSPGDPHLGLFHNSLLVMDMLGQADMIFVLSCLESRFLKLYMWPESTRTIWLSGGKVSGMGREEMRDIWWLNIVKVHDIRIRSCRDAAWNFLQQRYANNDKNKLQKPLRIEAYTWTLCAGPLGILSAFSLFPPHCIWAHAGLGDCQSRLLTAHQNHAWGVLYLSRPIRSLCSLRKD